MEFVYQVLPMQATLVWRYVSRANITPNGRLHGAQQAVIHAASTQRRASVLRRRCRAGSLRECGATDLAALIFLHTPGVVHQCRSILRPSRVLPCHAPGVYIRISGGCHCRCLASCATCCRDMLGDVEVPRVTRTSSSAIARRLDQRMDLRPPLKPTTPNQNRKAAGEPQS